jgi:hypothetical protein
VADHSEQVPSDGGAAPIGPLDTGLAAAAQVDSSDLKFLAVSTNTKDVSPFLAAEFRRIDELRAAGTITDVWVKADLSGAVLVLDCADAAAATAALNTLPIAINDAATVVLTEILDADSVRPSGGAAAAEPQRPCHQLRSAHGSRSSLEASGQAGS